MVTTSLKQRVRAISHRLAGGRVNSLNQPDEEGLTLIECLVAIVVIGLTVSTITPAFIVSAATRVQSQKIEQALEVAQGEIDYVRLLLERGTYTDAALPPSTAVSNFQPALWPGPTPGAANIVTVAASTPYQGLANNKTKKVDIDGDGTYEFAVQAYRTQGIALEGNSIVFGMGVRVYDIKAVENGTATMATTAARAGLTGGEGERGRRPLATIYTTVGKGDKANSYCQYIRVLNASASTPLTCSP